MSESNQELVVQLVAYEGEAEGENYTRLVVVSPRELSLNDGPVCWVKGSEPFEFQFIDLEFDSTDSGFFHSKSVSTDRICIEHEAQEDRIYKYTLSVMDVESGKTYDTKFRGDQPYNVRLGGGRPVIRPR